MRKANYARFHTNIYLPGVGEIGNVLPSHSKKFELSMSYDESGLYITVNGKEGVVPPGNISVVMLDAEEK